MVSIGKTKKLVVEKVLIVGRQSEGDLGALRVGESEEALIKEIEYRVNEGSKELFHAPPTEDTLLEAITGSENTLLPIKFLKNGTHACYGVCRVGIQSDGKFNPLGTGFLIGDGNYVMTNNHVLYDIKKASRYRFEFGYEEDTGSPHFICTPHVDEDEFLTCKDLDYTIIRITYPSEYMDYGRKYALQLMSSDLVNVQDRCNIIGHPKGRQKEVALQKNTVVMIDKKVIHYTTDTEEGSSGSPVFDNAWKVFALHHSAGKERVNMKTLKKQFVTNEGMRMEVIAKDVKERYSGLHNAIWNHRRNDNNNNKKDNNKLEY